MTDGLAHKVMIILETLLVSGDPLDLREIASRTDIPKSTVHRILSSLEADRWVIQDDRTRKYKPGVRISIFADSWRVSQALVAAADEPMRELVDRTSETSVLAVLDGHEARCIHILESPHAVKFSFKVGGTLPLHAGAAGKVLLAHSSPELRGIVLAGELKRFSPNTITNPEVLRSELELVAARGYAISIEEIDPGGTAVGVPLLHRKAGHLLGALIISGPKSKFERRIEDLVPLVLETARRIEERAVGSHSGRSL